MSGRWEIPSPSGYGIPATVGGPRDATATVVMLHGIFSDRDEHGRYPRQADLRHQAGRRTVRYDLQGHGEHPVPFVDSSVAGSVDDLRTVIGYCVRTWGGALSMVASSFGGSIFLLHEQAFGPSPLARSVLLNPVTDYRHTFYDHVGGELAQEFSAETWRTVAETGHAQLLPGKVMSGRLAVELLTMHPYRGFDALRTPTMVIHGSADASVSCAVTRKHSSRSKLVTFEEIPGADHAFTSAWEEDASFGLITRWFR